MYVEAESIHSKKRTYAEIRRKEFIISTVENIDIEQKIFIGKVSAINPNSHGVGHIGPTLFWRQITWKNVKCENFWKIS